MAGSPNSTGGQWAPSERPQDTAVGTLSLADDFTENAFVGKVLCAEGRHLQIYSWCCSCKHCDEIQHDFSRKTKSYHHFGKCPTCGTSQRMGYRCNNDPCMALLPVQDWRCHKCGEGHDWVKAIEEDDYWASVGDNTYIRKDAFIEMVETGKDMG